MKNTTLRNAISKAEQKINEADAAIQAIQPLLVFHNFPDENNLPQVTSGNGDEIFLEYDGKEMDINEALERMEEYGYISKYDF